MRNKITNLFIILLISALSGCFSDYNPNFNSIFIVLENNTGKNECSTDSIEVTFVVSNISTADTLNKIKADVKPKEKKSINVFIKLNETLLVKLYRKQDSTLLIEERFKVGKGVNQWNDPLPRTISYCKLPKLSFQNFSD